MTAPVEDELRRLAPRVLGVLVRRHGRFDPCEDAVQEALIAAAAQWPRDGVPEHPQAWLVTVAERRLTDAVRSEAARRRREEATAAAPPPGPAAGHDDTLALLLMCCHPALSAPSQIALTLRAVGGLTTAEIAQAFLVPEPTMAQRISRAKARIQATGIAAPDRERMPSVLHVLYLVFNEGYTATSGPELARADLTREAIRLTRTVHALLPEDARPHDHPGYGRGEVAGLLALMLLTEARRPARTGPDGELIPLAEQDRSLWDRAAIAEGLALIQHTLAHARVGPYQVQAAIAAVHAEAPDAERTDWAQVVALYELLDRLAPNPMARLSRAAAVGMARGPQAGLALVAELEADGALAGHHRLAAVRAHLHELAGDTDAARDGYRLAARRTTSLPEQRYLTARAARL